MLWPQPWPRPGSASYSARIPIRGRSPPRPPRSRRGRPSRGGRPGAPPRSRGGASASATQAAAWRSSNAGSGLAWIRWRQLEDLVAVRPRRPRRSGAWRRRTARPGGRRGGRSGLDGHGCSFVIGSRGSALDGQRRLGDDDHGEDEQGDRQLERALEPQGHEHGDDDADPGTPPDRPDPVAAIGDPAWRANTAEPEQRDASSGRGRARSGPPRASPAAGSTRGSRVVTTSATRTQATAAAAKTPRLVSRSRASIAPESSRAGAGVATADRRPRVAPRARRARSASRSSIEVGAGRRAVAAALVGSGESARPVAQVGGPPAGPLRADDVRRPVVADVEDRRGRRSPSAASAARKIAGCGLIVPTRCETTTAAQVAGPAGRLDVAVDRGRERPVREDPEP